MKVIFISNYLSNKSIDILYLCKALYYMNLRKGTFYNSTIFPLRKINFKQSKMFYP